MKKYIYVDKNSKLIEIDNNSELINTNDIKLKDSSYLNIDYSWLIEEDGVLNFEDQSFDVKVGDVVFALYSPFREGNKREIVIVNAPGILDNYKKTTELEELEKKKRVCCNDCPCSCDK